MVKSNNILEPLGKVVVSLNLLNIVMIILESFGITAKVMKHLGNFKETPVLNQIN